MVTDPDVLAAHRQDRALTDAGWPLALVRPRTTEDVQAVLRWASATGTPVVTRGAGTGLSGAAAAIEGCLVLSTARMLEVRIDADDLVAVVQPGVVNADLKAAARDHGLTYPPDPSSYEESTVGGNIATNAGGLCCVKYGVTRDYVLGLEVVLADGRVVDLRGRTVKDVAGYDLLGLFVGSEGTLGVVTRATVRLRPLPPPPATMVASFPDLESGGRAVSAIVRSATLSAVEIMDGDAVRAVERYRPMGLDASVECLLVVQSDSAAGMQDVEAAERICLKHGADFTAVTEDRAEGEVFMAARRAAIPALFEEVGCSSRTSVSHCRGSATCLQRYVRWPTRRRPGSPLSDMPATATSTRSSATTPTTSTQRRAPRRHSRRSCVLRWTSAAPSQASTGSGR